MITHEEKLIGGVAIVNCIEDPIMAYESLEIEPVLRMALNPAIPQISRTLRSRK